MEGLAALLDMTEAGLAGFILVFVRVGAIAALLPGFGEQAIPARVRLGVAFAFALVVWPMVAPGLVTPDPARPFAAMLLVETSIGLMLGIAIRLMVMVLQLAGAIAAQSTALAQIFGAGRRPRPDAGDRQHPDARRRHARGRLGAARQGGAGDGALLRDPADGAAGAGRGRGALGHGAGRAGLRARLLASRRRS